MISAPWYKGAPLGGRRKRGAFNEAIGRSRGGRTTKIHALTDDHGRPRVLALTPGNTGDVTVAPALIEAAGPFSRLLADKAYDANWLRELIAEQGAEAVILATAHEKSSFPTMPSPTASAT